MKHSFFGINADISKPVRILLNTMPFILIVVGYAIASHLYLLENPAGKLLPSFSQMGEQLWKMATQPERRSGELLLWLDMFSSLQRLLMALFVSAVMGLFMGVIMAFYPLPRELFLPFVTFFSNTPIIALVAIIMIVFGTGEVFKFVLIFLGTFFIVTRDVHRSANTIPDEQVTKALSLGASSFGTVFRLMLPQIMPHLLTAVKLVLGAAWIYLISSEMIASEDGLGYRIALVRRFLDMKTIIPYVAVVTLIAFILDSALRVIIAKGYPWFKTDK